MTSETPKETMVAVGSDNESTDDYISFVSEDLDISGSITDLIQDTDDTISQNTVEDQNAEGSAPPQMWNKIIRRLSKKRGQSIKSTRSGQSVIVDSLPEEQLEWLQGDRFLDRLEHDKDIDHAALQKEVDTLQATHGKKKKTCRHKMGSFLSSGPCRVIVLAIAFLDAVIIITSAVLGIHVLIDKVGYKDCQAKNLIRILITETPSLKKETWDSVYDVLSKSQLAPDADGATGLVKAKRSLYNVQDGIYPSTRGRRMREGRSIDQVESSPYYAEQLVRNVEKILERLAGGAGGRTPRRTNHVDDAKLLDVHQTRRHKRAAQNDEKIDLTKIPPFIKCQELEDHNDRLYALNHDLHYASVTLLSILLLEVILKIVAMDLEFFKHKLEILDALVITVSFIVDVYYIGRVNRANAIPFAMFLFIWQMIRVATGFINQDKKRIEFLMHVIKRSNKMKKLRLAKVIKRLQERERHLHQLRALCVELGATQEQLDSAVPTKQEEFLGPATIPKKLSAASIAKNVLSASLDALGRGVSVPSDLTPRSRRLQYNKGRALSLGDSGQPNSVVLKSVQYTSSIYKPNFQRPFGRGSNASDDSMKTDDNVSLRKLSSSSSDCDLSKNPENDVNEINEAIGTSPVEMTTARSDCCAVSSEPSSPAKNDIDRRQPNTVTTSSEFSGKDAADRRPTVTQSELDNVIQRANSTALPSCDLDTICEEAAGDSSKAQVTKL